MSTQWVASRLIPVDFSSETIIRWDIISIVAITLLHFFGKICNSATRHARVPGVPVVGKKWRWEPDLITRYRSSQSTWKIVQDAAAQYPNQIFTVIRPDSNVTVIPRKFIEEIHNQPETILVSTDAFVSDLMGKYTRVHILLDGHVGGLAVLKRLTPRLAPFARNTAEELLIAARVELPPATNEWKEICLNKHVVMVVSRLTAKLFVGEPLCRNPDWVSLNLDLVKDIFMTILIMRHFPTFMHPFLGAILPSRRALESKFRRIHSFLIPLIEKRRKAAETDPDFQAPNDVLFWMDEMATGVQKSPSWLATRYIWTLIGSLHSVSEIVMNSIYDLCEMPEYVKPLRNEIDEVLKGGKEWNKSSAQSLHRLDSFMREAKSLENVVGFKRITRVPLILSDSTYIPADTYICVATTSPSLDGFPGCDEKSFDGFRYYRHRVATRSQRNDYTATDQGHIHFGHGRHACPGRFAAAIEIKLILAHLIQTYDFKQVPGKGRPQPQTLLEFTFNDPDAMVLMRGRGGGDRSDS